MSYPRILTIQDISCVGQCSLTVALPILSACGVETCVLPSAVLSTHTGGFKGYTFRDLTDDMPSILAHWQKEGILFDGVYTGYLGSTRQIGYVRDILAAVRRPGAPAVIDPAMADNGKLYAGFDDVYVAGMRTLCADADYLLPNITEACLLTDTPWQETYDRAYVDSLLARLDGLGAKCTVLTGVSLRPGMTGVMVHSAVGTEYYEHVLLPNSCHGTGDVYASAFAGAILRGVTPFEAAVIAADYTVACIRATAEEPGHWYGAKFEPVLPVLIRKLEAAAGTD
jgi:pyridoxine kinase